MVSGWSKKNQKIGWFSVLKTTKKIILTVEGKKHFRTNDIDRFCENEVGSDKVRDHCHLTSKYRDLALNKCLIIVTR